MLRTTVLIALRSLRRNRGFALLNVAGLALGLACVLLIALFVRDERLVDQYHENVERIARLQVDMIEDGRVDPSGSTQGDLAPALLREMPEVEAAVRFTNADPVIRAGETVLQAEGGLLYADPEVFDVFSYPLLAGSPDALRGPGRIVLTETMARSLFGSTDVLGETAYVGGETLTVTAVMADVPRQSHFTFDGLISLETLEDPGWLYGNWFTVAFTTFALLHEDASMEAFEAKLPAFAQAAAGDAMAEAGTDLVFKIRPLTELYLTAELGRGTFGSASTLRILMLVALFVLVVAGVNFTNLATARSLDRAREVGVRKTLGAMRGGLAVQFLAEAVVLSLASLVLAIGLAQLALPLLRDLTQKPLALLDLGPWWIGFVVLAIATGLLAGAYPAFVLSGFRPAEVIKGRFATSGRGSGLRRALVVLQFGVSVALIAATVVVFSQLRYMQSQDLGLDLGGDQTQLLVLRYNGDSTVVSQLPEVRERLAAVPGVRGVTASISTPTAGQATAGGEVEAPSGEMKSIDVLMTVADPAYASVNGLTLVAGRAPRETVPEGVRDMALNEAAIRQIGYQNPEDALGKTVQFWGFEGEVSGVVRDYHVQGLQAKVQPLALADARGIEFMLSALTMRVETASLPETLSEIETAWAAVAPSRPFRYSFLDEDFAAQYVAEQRFGRLFALLSGLAILIACLGLFGLAAHAAATRTKEIGVRRVHGATVPQVVVLMSRGVVGLVALGLALATPVVIVGMSNWLDGFAYRISVGWIPLALAGAVVLLLAVATVAGHAIRAALADPVHALRSE